MKKVFIFFLIAFSLMACDQKQIFDSYSEIGSKGWHQDSVLNFNFSIADTVAAHNLYVNIRNKGNYSNSNLWLFMNIDSPDGSRVSDTVEFTLADPTGRWLGSGLGDLHDNRIIYRSNVFFPKTGEYSFSIRHGMRDEILKGIRDVGIRVEKIK